MKTTAPYLCAGLLCLSGILHAQTPANVITLDLPPIWKEAGPQARQVAGLIARRQAQRSLVERIYGLPVNSSTIVYDVIRADDDIRTSVDRLLLGLTEDRTTMKYSDDGRVELDCKLAIATVKETLRREVERKKIAGVTISEKEWSDFEYKTIPKVLVETGTGAIPGSDGEKRIQARRSAELDAYRKLAERMLGVQVTSQTTVKNFVLESDYIKTRVAGVLKGAKKKNVSYVADDNSCLVEMEINMENVFEVIKNYYAKKESGVTTNKIEISERTEPLTFSETGEGSPRPADWRAEVLTNQNPKPFEETVTIIERYIGQRIIP